MKPFLTISTLLIALLFVADVEDARAQRLQLFGAPYVSYGLDVPNQVADRGSMAIGALGHGHLRLSRRLSVVLNPDFEYYLLDVRTPEKVTGIQLDGNILLMLGLDDWEDEYKFFSVVRPYLGLGIALTSVSGDNALAGYVSGSDIGFNVLAGTVYGAGTVRVFFQGRATFGDSNLYVNDTPYVFDELSFQGGLLFRLHKKRRHHTDPDSQM